MWQSASVVRGSRVSKQRIAVLAATLAVFCARPLPAAAQAGPAGEYPDRPSGLEKLAKEILKAQSKAETSRTTAILEGLLLPNASAWYSTVFDEQTVGSLSRLYEAERARLPQDLEEFFSRAEADHFTGVQALRYESSCDDGAGEFVFGVLFARAVPVPLYELRLINGNSFRRLWALAYVDGAFRFVGQLRPPDHLVPVATRALPPEEELKNEVTKRLNLSGEIQMAKLIHKVAPGYPDLARREHVQGTVRIHTIIGKDGSLRAMQVVKGYCSLAEAAVTAVRQWRYRPTMLEGMPVEVETDIDVVFQLYR